MAPRSSQQLRNLHRIQRRPFEQLVAADPETQPILQRAIRAQAPYFAIVFAGAPDWAQPIIAAAIHLHTGTRARKH